jgi:hypothetical protein
MNFNTMRNYLLILLLLLSFYGTKAYSKGGDSTLCINDSLIFYKKADLLKSATEGSLAKLLIKTAKSFEGTPYVGKTLEGNNHESLVVNLRELDCSTFIESSLAIALTLKSGNITFAEYKNNLETLRYRDGNLEGYESRLHYFSDWIYDNQRKGIIKDITKKLGGIPYTKEINFMSMHPGFYAQLNNNPAVVDSICQIEKEITSRKYYFIPKEKVEAIEPRLDEGMIVAITSAVTGLDIAHVGFLVKVNGRIHLLHASSDAVKVIVGEKPLSAYLAGNKKQTGIMVLKVLK